MVISPTFQTVHRASPGTLEPLRCRWYRILNWGLLSWTITSNRNYTRHHILTYIFILSIKKQTKRTFHGHIPWIYFLWIFQKWSPHLLLPGSSQLVVSQLATLLAGSGASGGSSGGSGGLVFAEDRPGVFAGDPATASHLHVDRKPLLQFCALGWMDWDGMGMDWELMGIDGNWWEMGKDNERHGDRHWLNMSLGNIYAWIYG